MTLRASASAFASSAAPTIVVPASTLGGDVLYIVTAGGWNPSATPPAGWTLLQNQTGLFWNWAIYYKIAAGTFGSPSSDASTTITLTYTGGTFDTQTAIYVTTGGFVTPTLTTIASNASTAGTLNLTSNVNELILYYGSTRPNAAVTVTLSSGTTDVTRSSDTNSGSVIGHTTALTTTTAQTLTPSTAGSGSTGRFYAALQLFVPFTDAFAIAGAIAGLFSMSNVDTTGWTTEGGEPGGLSHTGWATFTPSQTRLYTLSTVGSDYDTVLSVYTGTIISSLTLVATDDNSGGSGTSQISYLSLTAGITYYIQIGAQAAGSGGSLSFTLTPLSHARLGAITAEALTTSAVAPSQRLGAVSAEVITGAAGGSLPGVPDRRLGAITLEVLTPKNTVFIGWGTLQ